MNSVRSNNLRNINRLNHQVAKICGLENLSLWQILTERIKPCIQLCYTTFHSLYLNEFQKSFHGKNELFSLIVLSELSNYVLMDKIFFFAKKSLSFIIPPLLISSHMELLIQEEKFVQDVEYSEMVS